LEQELQALAQSVELKESLIAELVGKEREWGATKAQYQRRLEQLQAELERMHRDLAGLRGQLQESAGLKEQTRQMEEEQRRLERLISEQVECIRKKQQEFGHLRDLRQQDRCKIRELEAEVSHMVSSQREKEARLQAERRREAQQIGELQRRLAREGQRVRDLEAENLRQRESLKLGKSQQRQRSATPLSRKGSSAGTLALAARAQSVDVAAAGDRGGGGSSSSSSSRAHRLEQQIDEHIRRQEASQGLDEDLRKQEALLRKKEQYLSYRRKISEKDGLEQQEARGQLQQLEAQLSRVELELAEAQRGSLEAGAAEPGAALRARAQREALTAERGELQREVQGKRAEGLGILHDIDERLEGLQDEIDFREARIAKARQLVRPASGGTGSLDAELAGVPAEDAKELLCRYCKKIIKLRQREKQNLKRFAAAEAQLQERSRQVSELQQVLRLQSANSSKAISKVTKEYEGQIRLLLQQLSVEQQRRGPEQPPEEGGPAAGASGSLPQQLVGSTGGGGSGEGALCGIAGSTGSLALAEANELQQLRRDNQYYKAVNRELKRRLCSAPEPGDAAGDGQQAPLAAEVEQLRREKEALCEERERFKAKIQSLQQYHSRLHNLSAPGGREEPEVDAAAEPPQPG